MAGWPGRRESGRSSRTGARSTSTTWRSASRPVSRWSDSEVKSLRAGHVSLGEAYATVRDNEVFLVGASIEPYAQAGMSGHDRTRDRKLLLHRREIARIRQRTDEKGFTLIPLRMYFKDGRVKIEIGLGRGKNIADKRQNLAERDAKREIDRALRDAARG